MVVTWILVIFGSQITGEPLDLNNFIGSLAFNHEPEAGVIAGLMTWIPIVFVLIDYVINGKWTWLPWKRNKD